MKACFFDIDGTLVATGGAGQVAFAETFAEQFGVERLSDRVSFAGRSDRAIATELMETHGVEASRENWDRFRSMYIGRLAESLPRRPGAVLPGVEGLIGRLHARGDVLLALLTGNIRAAAEQKLRHYGLWESFLTEGRVVGGFGDDHLDRNDIAAAAVAAARNHHQRGRGAGLNAAAGRDTLVVIGDTPNDIRCGKSVGAWTVAVPTGFTPADELRPHGPDLLVQTLEDAAPLLARFD